MNHRALFHVDSFSDFVKACRAPYECVQGCLSAFA